MGADRQTDLFVEDVQCNSVLWFPEQTRGRDGEFLDDGICPRIVGVVDIPVPYPLLRAILSVQPKRGRFFIMTSNDAADILP